MQIQINTDENVDGTAERLAQWQATIEQGLAPHARQLSRVECHLGDENAGKSGSADKRCALEARPLNQEPVAVTHHAGGVDEALSGAVRKLRNALETRFGKRQSHKGAPSIRDMGAV